MVRSKDIGIYQTGGAIRGFVQLEAEERERFATFASKAVAAGLAERQVRLAEKQGQLFNEFVTTAIEKSGMTDDMALEFRKALATEIRDQMTLSD